MRLVLQVQLTKRAARNGLGKPDNSIMVNNGTLLDRGTRDNARGGERKPENGRQHDDRGRKREACIWREDGERKLGTPSANRVR